MIFLTGPFTLNEMTEWFSAGYLLTGPFTSNEMTEWFSAGYFITNLQGKEAVMKIKSPMGLYLL